MKIVESAPRVRIKRWDSKERPTMATLSSLLESEGMQVYASSDPPGARYRTHRHDHAEVRFIVAGRFRFGIGDEVFELRAGDRMDLEAGTPHWAEVVGDESVVYVCGSR